MKAYREEFLLYYSFRSWQEDVILRLRLAGNLRSVLSGSYIFFIEFRLSIVHGPMYIHLPGLKSMP